MTKNKLETYRISNVEDFLSSIAWGNDLFEAISCDYEEDEEGMDWAFNPSPESEELEECGATIKVDREDDLPMQYWGSSIYGDPDDIAERLTEKFIDGNTIPDEMYKYIKNQFLNSLPAFN